MAPFILLILGVSGVYCDGHSVRYYETVVSAPGSGLPVYSIVGYVDDREITNYNSDTRQCLPKTEWMMKLEPEYWKAETQPYQAREAVMKHFLQSWTARFKHTEGFHIVQRMYGCELRDDGSTVGYDQYGYDGRDFLYLDTQSWLYIPAMHEAQITTQRWNSPEEREGERQKNYLENICIEWLKKYINYGREDLERREMNSEVEQPKLLPGMKKLDEDSHSLRLYETAVSAPGSGLPVFSIVGYVDNRELVNYNSDTRRNLPKTEWMKTVEPEHWNTERQTKSYQARQDYLKQHLQTMMAQFNHTKGIHTLQRMTGCELRDDGSTVVYEQWGYDGRDLLYLDTQSKLYIPAMHEAQIITQGWNNPEDRWWEIWKNEMENICIEQLKKYINYGREDLERRVRPEVKVWGRQHPDGVTRLQCLAYGFHPRAVDVKWVRNGEDHIPSDEASPILPHPDGTYQTRVSVEVPTREGDTYSCHVEHSSLNETLSIPWEMNSEVDQPEILPGMKKVDEGMQIIFKMIDEFHAPVNKLKEYFLRLKNLVDQKQ
ncbi:class I histocompatibility antigen, F10 alpha chain-like isoform X3 [Hyperolius riggenbachi]|uniref:class I histocompatibility antigen, F10 alpha chain-like isoform X3 n=1 Tax=Hyperolius riggenbachi TaxID=752182 RepID=UPI0035A2B3E4